MTSSSSDQNLILIVDDTPANLTVISEALSDAGFEIAIAISGERALEQIQREPPDLILLDIMMPGIGGFETCKRLKSDPKVSMIPVIFMTALADVESKIQGLELGAVDYITKPFQEREVLARIKTHLELRKTQIKLQKSEQRLESILHSLKEVVWSARLKPFELLYLNPVVKQIYGHEPEQLIRDPLCWLEMVHPDDQLQLQKRLNAPDPSGPLDLEYRILRLDGEVRWVHCQAHVYFHTTEQRFRVDGIVHDISDRKQAEHQLRYTAEHDSLTNLANRAYFVTQLNQLLGRPHDRKSDQFALLFIDLDRFKAINDSLGHNVGDQLLKRVSQVLLDSIRPTDLVARLGGDEFTLLLRNVSEIEEVIIVSNRIQKKLQNSIQIGKKSFNMTASIGIVIDCSQYDSAESALRDADIAMYQAKSLGKACHQLFSQEMYEQAIQKLRLESEIKHALQEGEFFLHYQPIKRLDTGEICGFEALARWEHPVRGFVSPAEFIPIAEETGLIVPLGEYVLREACRQMKNWQQMYPAAAGLTMSVNLSSRQLRSDNFLDILHRIVSESHLKSSNLKLEITESLLMENSAATLQLFQQLQDQGFRLSLDDFGTGYSSLSYLHRFPINTLKIDRSFVQKIEPGLSSFEIIRTITALAKTLQMDVVAEGVETAQQAEYLKELHCDMVQGYFFSKPLNTAAATQYLQDELQPQSLLSSST